MDAMDTHYDVLGCSVGSSFDELKAAYQKLALKHHPDKCTDRSASSDLFSRIDEAWKTLRDPETRKTYDDALKQSEMEGQSLLYGTFSLKDLQYDSSNEEYSYACRCGGAYCFSKKDVEEFNSYLVGCDECSLMISVDLQS